ncbi:MAG: tetraacyldisaccharide 4'-kinase [Candidatus Thiodiazotropha sp. (ex Epidulcina cf. delphinae)]|nr:tetraacyldisaccharide 4'-kinase [Candidatus Thiodiazotropha sp. (ex Epidulcina cf. delphinae)]
MKSFIEASWNGWHVLTLLLLPLSGLFCLVSGIRRLLYRIGWLPTRILGVPVIVVGNISVGGTGKTPLVIWLADKLTEMGFKPGIITRGYGGESDHWPQEVTITSQAQQVGDEAVLLKHRTGCPVFVGPDRPETGERLLSAYACDLIISDDGLQHYALHRDLEIVVIDGVRRFGNGVCLPAGPLRETPTRLARADLLISNGEARQGEYLMRVAGTEAVALDDRDRSRHLASFADSPVHAIAGIGRPERFFSMLEAAGLEVERRPFPDHHPYRADDLQAFSSQPVLMTEKDAVKCMAFARPNHWYVPAMVEVEAGFERQLEALIKRLTDG